jgi:hypothetical protein
MEIDKNSIAQGRGKPMPALQHRKPLLPRRLASQVLPRTSVWTKTGKTDPVGTAALGP